MAVQETQNELRDREITVAFRTQGYWDESHRFTTKRWVPGTNVGNVFFSEIVDVPLPIRESFMHSKVGMALARFRTLLPF